MSSFVHIAQTFSSISWENFILSPMKLKTVTESTNFSLLNLRIWFGSCVSNCSHRGIRFSRASRLTCSMPHRQSLEMQLAARSLIDKRICWQIMRGLEEIPYVALTLTLMFLSLFTQTHASNSSGRMQQTTRSKFFTRLSNFGFLRSFRDIMFYSSFKYFFSFSTKK